MVSKGAIPQSDITKGEEIGSELPESVRQSLRDQDKLCADCLHSPTMLCSGARLWPDSQAFLGFSRKPCYRIAASNALDSTIKTLQGAGMRRTHALSVAGRILEDYARVPSIDIATRQVKISKPRRIISPGAVSKDDINLLTLEISSYIVLNPGAVRILDCVFIPNHFYNQPETRDSWFGSPLVVVVSGVSEVDWTTAPLRQFSQWIMELMDNTDASFFIESSPLLPDAIRSRLA